MTGPSVNPDGEGDSTSLGLLARVKAQDPAAWVHVVTVYGPLIDSWTRRAGLAGADVDDVRQEVLGAAARAIGTFHRDRPGDSFRAWLRVITGNKLRDHWRRTGGGVAAGGSDALRQLHDLPADESDPDGAADEMSLVDRRALELIRGQFEVRTWQAFWRVVIDSHSPADVAADLGMTVNAVYLAKGRILARFREEFAELIDQ